jgi:tetratricopeptide (TPR) repeat protein
VTIRRIALVLLAAAGPLRAQTPALDSLRAGIQADSLDPQRHYALGLGLLRERRYDAADSAFGRAIALDPRHASALLGWSVAQDRNTRYWDAIRRRGRDTALAAENRRRDDAFKRAFLVDPFLDILPLAWASRRRAEMPAIAEYARAYAFVDSVIGYLLGFARGPRAVIDSMPAGLIFSRALLAARVNRLVVARSDIQVLLRRSLARERGDTVLVTPLPTNELRYLLAAIQQRIGNRDQAMSLYREVATNDLGNFMALVQLARLHEAGQEWSQAVDARRGAPRRTGVARRRRPIRASRSWSFPARAHASPRPGAAHRAPCARRPACDPLRRGCR